MEVTRMNTSALESLQRPRPTDKVNQANQADKATQAKEADLARQEADTSRKASAQPAPVVNTQGQVTGRLLNVSA